MRIAIAATAALMLWSGAAAAAEQFSCPSLSLPSGKPARVESISVFDGPPAEMADLVPDNADTSSREPPYWTLGKPERPTWVVCHYRKLKGTREFALPKAYTKCRLTGHGKAWDGLSCE